MTKLFDGYAQFINWFPVARVDGKTDKIPIGIGGIPINYMDSRNWLTLDAANALASTLGAGVGFVFTSNDPFFVVDIDSCFDGREWSDFSRLILSAFPGCAVEVSQSGKGLHIFGVGSSDNHRCTNKEMGLEFYTGSRFIALSGNPITGDTTTNGQAGVNWLVSNYLLKSNGGIEAEWSTVPCDEWSGPDDDETLIMIAKRSRSAAAVFGGRAGFADLYDGNVEMLQVSYPTSAATAQYGYSEADAALCAHLAFYTGKNCERMERIFNTSALGKRDKWVDREDYRRRTILNAVAICKSVYTGKSKSTDVEPADPIGTMPMVVSHDGVQTETGNQLKTGSQFLDLTGQLEHFANCAYVANQHQIFTPKYGLLSPDRFRVLYGGYDFAIAWSGKPSKNAFEVFTESQLYNFPKVVRTCFRPELPPYSIIIEEGDGVINTYTPVPVESRPGDCAPFLDLLARILPDLRDRTILLSYAAACVQHVGVKFQWAPLLQGCQGNGKSFIATAISKSVGERYSHAPNASDLKGNGLKFTGWLHEKLFINIEDLFPDGRQDVQEALKDKITNRRIEFQHKGRGQFMGDNRANFFFAVNPKDALIKTLDDRRYCVFYTAQQSNTDIIKSGMGGSYFPDLYNWARAGGYAFITNYLMSYSIPEEFNPATLCQRAPDTTSTTEAVGLSASKAELEIKEAVDEGQVGFRGGWISSVALDRLLTDRRTPVALNKRRELLEALGYVLKERLNNPSAIDGGKKAVLYVLRESSLVNLPSGVTTATAYTHAQQGPAVTLQAVS